MGHTLFCSKCKFIYNKLYKKYHSYYFLLSYFGMIKISQSNKTRVYFFLHINLGDSVIAYATALLEVSGTILGPDQIFV